DKAKSDVDVLVKLTKPVGFFSFINLEDQLTKILGQKVDLATENSLKPIIKNEILKEVVYV
ncbi:MAG: nucleotidyltransferase domain-containing protein, partial [bacterium]|nr:nucleotidyltransferase domain-containing protein [bacterium]